MVLSTDTNNVVQLHEPKLRLPSYYELIHDQGFSIDEVQSLIAQLPDEDQAAIYYDWRFWGRPSQIPPDWDWRVAFLKGGRGSGKTWSGANWINEKAQTCKRLILVGRTAADVRDTMIEGSSGILSVSPPWFMPIYEPAKRRVVWPNGHFALCFSADEPSMLRGPQAEAGWADEIASWRKLVETWRNLTLCMRLGSSPQILATSTPRPLALIKEILARPTTHSATENTMENLHNLAPQWAEEVLALYQGTRLGRQELGGELLDDNPNALWSRAIIDKYRVMTIPSGLDTIIVAVDPPSSDTPSERTAEAGIIVAGRKGKKRSTTSHSYILDDLSLGGVDARPEKWGATAVRAFHNHKADKIVAEQNNGGAMVRSTIQAIDPNVPVELVWASRGKEIRAQPVSTLYETGRVHHVANFPELEDEQCVAKGTLIAASIGLVPIEDVVVGMYVYTRRGLRQVTKSKRTIESAQVYEVKSESGLSLVATGNHPVYSASAGEFIPAAMLRRGERILSWESMGTLYIGTERSGTLPEMGIINRIGEDYYTLQSGSIALDESQMGLLSTIKTLISKIPLILITYRKSLTQNILEYMTTVHMGFSRVIHELLTCGTTENLRELFVPTAIAHLNLLGCAPPIVARSVGSNPTVMTIEVMDSLGMVNHSRLEDQEAPIISSVKKLDKKQPVYNIEVDGEHEYFANGILTHNCEWEPGVNDKDMKKDRMDACVWAITELMLGDMAQGKPFQSAVSAPRQGYTTPVLGGGR